MSHEAERLYERARALPPDDRADFLRDACRDDPELRDELLSLLERAERAEAFFGLLEDTRSSATVSGGGGGEPSDRGRDRASGGADPPPSVPELPPGHTVAHYRIEEKVGAGGMGSVYRARDTRLGRDVALKFLPTAPGNDEEAGERLLAEARAAAALEHPNICTVHEIGETGDGRPFIAMAYYRGETLKERLRRGALRTEEAVAVATQLAGALAAAHAREIVHRDVKPGNVMLAEDGTVKLLDFGLAESADVALARAGARRGTLPYMSPEQVRGETPDPRSDLWSLGVTLYEMLTGTKPFRGGSDVELLEGILHRDPEPLRQRSPGTPEPLERVVERLLRKAPDARYAGARELRADLVRALPPTDRAPGPAAAGRRRRALATVGAAAFLAALAAGIVWLPRDGREAVRSGGAGAEALRGRTPRVAAHELVVRASDQSLFRSDSGVLRGVGYLEQAIALDSTYAAAHAALAVMYMVLSGREDPGMPVREARALAREAAAKAVVLDDSLADAHAALALVRQYLDRDLASAEAGLRRAIELDPARSRFHQWLAILYVQAGLYGEALAPARRALELDPLSASANAELAHALLVNGRYEDALARLRRIAGLEPPLLRAAPYAAQAHALQGRWSDAIAAVRPRAEEGASRALGLYGYLLARAGRRGEALDVLETLLDRWRDGTSRAFEVAIVYAGLEDLERAFAWLDRSVDDRSAMLSNFHIMEPIFEDLHRDPRFESVAESLGIRRW